MEESRHYAGLSLEKALTLNTLIQDLFQMSTREAMEMQFKLNREEISVSDYFAQLDEKFRAEQDNPRIRIKVALSCKRRARDCPSLMIDRIRIEQVFNNLINNAVKNIPGEGKITISCGCADRAGMEAMDRGLLRIFVEDNGVGIEKEDIPYIFEMFYKKPNINQVQGTGIGLSISKEIIQSHGGRLFVESEAGAGAMFTIELEALRRAECISADSQYTIKPAVET
jgi:signal transduction histidine kinase